MMNERDDELISAYLDGELSHEEANAFRERLLRDPDLRREMDAQAANDELLREYAASIDQRPMSEALSDVMPSPAASSQREITSRRLTRYALAAMLVLGIGFVGYESAGPSADPFDGLDQAFTGERLSSRDGEIEVIASFHTRDHGICRELRAPESRLVVCRSEGSWQTHVSIPEAQTNPEVYLPAGPEGETAVDKFVKEQIHGDVLNPADELALMERGWR